MPECVLEAVENQPAALVWTFFWDLSSLLLAHLLLVCQCQVSGYQESVACHEIESCDDFDFSNFAQDYFGYFKYFVFPYEFIVLFFCFYKEYHQYFNKQINEFSIKVS